jgi:hypothetical protein
MILLNHGGDLNRFNNKGCTPCAYCTYDMLNYLNLKDAVTHVNIETGV